MGKLKPVKANFLDRVIAAVAPRWGLKRLQARTRLELANYYRGADSSRLRSDWILTAMSDETPPGWELDRLRSRSRDLNRNDPVASGATSTLGINVIGSGLRPQSRIRADYLGISNEQTQKLQKQAEHIWQTWKSQADAANRLDFDEIQFLAFRKVIEDGEIIALPIWATENWRYLNRAIELIEADRLKSQNYQAFNDTGIKFGPRGEPISYSIASIDEKNKVTYKTIAARDSNGRPKILHVFPTLRPGQSRGIPYFASVLSYFKDLADYLEAEIVAARVAACLAIFITTQDPYGTLAGVTAEREPSTNARIQQIEPGLVGYLNPGEAVNVVDPKRPGDTFNGFIEGMFRIIGVALGLPYELLIKDFSKTNYSSARAALLEGRRVFLNWRSWFARKFCQPIWELVLEEAFLRGLFEAPDFYRYKSEYCRAQWIGGAWGWVDPVKEVEASKKAIDYSLSTLAEEAAGQGRDWEEVLEQRAKENQKIEELGLSIINLKAPKEDKNNAESQKE